MTSIAILRRGIESFRLIIKNELLIIMREEATPVIKEKVLGSYKELYGVVQGDYDDLKPETYEALFMDRTENFDFIAESDTGISMRCPSIDNFDFTGGLELVGGIINGFPGNYYKVKAADYTKIAGEATSSMYNRSTYLVDESNPFLNNFNKDTLDKFEFSNSPPIDVFGEANSYIKGNIRIWINRAIRKAEIILKNFVSGVK